MSDGAFRQVVLTLEELEEKLSNGLDAASNRKVAEALESLGEAYNFAVRLSHVILNCIAAVQNMDERRH